MKKATSFCPWPSNKTAMDGVKPSMAGKLRFHTYNSRHHQFFICKFFITGLISLKKNKVKTETDFFGLYGLYGLYGSNNQRNRSNISLDGFIFVLYNCSVL